MRCDAIHHFPWSTEPQRRRRVMFARRDALRRKMMIESRVLSTGLCTARRCEGKARVNCDRDRRMHKQPVEWTIVGRNCKYSYYSMAQRETFCYVTVSV